MIRKLQFLFLFTLWLVTLFSAFVSQAQSTDALTVAHLVRYAGVARDLNGRPMSGVVGVTFALYAEKTSTAAL